MSEIYPTNKELKAAARAASEFESSPSHLCANSYLDHKGRCWPGQALAPSLGVTPAGRCFAGVSFLKDNLPVPFRGISPSGNALYTVLIDDDRGEEVAAAILTLLRPWRVDLWARFKRKFHKLIPIWSR